ncbi:MAG: FAD-dependent oxidoreductase [Thermomicrobiales bacterium]
MTVARIPHIVVVGAGIVGAALAFRLAEKGAPVVLLDRATDAGEGATAASFGGVNAAGATAPEAIALVQAAIEEHRRLAWRMAPAPWYHADGSLQWSSDPERLAARVAQLREWGYSATLLPAGQARTDLEPAMSITDPEALVAWYPDEGWADAAAMTRQLVKAVRNSGGRVLFGPEREVVAIERSDDRVTGVTLAGGQTIPASRVVNAAGASAAHVAALVGRIVPMMAPVGLAVRAELDEEAPVKRPVVTDRIVLRPDGPGRVWLVPRRDLADASRVALDDAEVRQVMIDARAVVPALASARPVAAVAAAYAVPASGYLSAGAVPGIAGYYEIAAYSGVTVAPLLARALTDEMLGRGANPLLAPFAPRS